MMRERLSLDDLLKLLTDVEIYHEWCSCHGYQRQLDAKLPNGKCVSLMKTYRGYHLVVGSRYADEKDFCPDPISSFEVERRLIQELQEVLNERT